MDHINNLFKELSAIYGSRLDVRFARPGYIPGTRVTDATGKLEASPGAALPTSLRVKTFEIRPGQKARSISTFTTQKENLRGAFRSVLSKGYPGDKEGIAAGITFAYDPEMLRRLGLRTGIASSDALPGSAFAGGRGPVVGVKQLVREVFPELSLGKDTTIESMAKAMGIEFTPGMDTGKGAGIPELLERMVGAAYQKDPLAVRRSLARAGVRGLSGVTSSVINNADPHSIDRYMGSINVIPKGISNKAAGRSLHISGEEHLPSFIAGVRTHFGRDYAETIQRFASDVFEQAGNPSDVALLLTKNRRLFIGVAGVPEAYYELPTERAGIVSLKGKLASARRMMLPGKGGKQYLRPSTSLYLEAFRAGMAEFGQGFANISAALEKGHIQAAKRSALGHGVKWSDLKSTLHSLGSVSLHEGLYDTRTVIASSSILERFESVLGQGIGDILSRKSPAGLTKRLEDALTRDIYKAQGIAGGRGVDIASYHLVKGKGNKGILPSHRLAELFIPGSFTERHYKKGLYQVRGRAEIADVRQIARITSTRAKAGLGGPSPVVVAPFARAIERQLTRSWSNLLGKKVSPLVEMSALVGVIGTEGSPLAMRQFGESGAYKTMRGSRMLKRSSPTVGRDISVSADEMSNILQTMRGGSTNPKWDELISRAQQGKFTQIHENLEISKFARKKMRDVVPRGARNLRSVEYDQYSNTFKLRFSTAEGVSPSDALLLGNQRISARVGSEAFLKESYGTLASATDLITNADTFSTIGKANIQFYHMLGLTETARGQKSGGAKKFIELYKELGGSAPLELVQNNRISWNAKKFKADQLESALRTSEQVLRKMGFSMGQIYGLAYSTPEAGPGILSMMGLREDLGTAGQVAGRGTLERAMRGDYSKGVYAFMSSITRRARDLEDVLSNERSFRMSLETMHLMSLSIGEMFRGVPTEGGRVAKTSMDHPMYAKLAKHFQKTTGATLTGATATGNFAILPNEMKQIAYALDYQMPDKKGMFRGRRVLSREQAAKEFVFGDNGINTTMLNRQGIGMEELLSKKILNLKEGIYVDLGDAFDLPLSLEKGAKIRQAKGGTRAIYIPAAQEFRAMTGVEAGVGTQRGHMLHSIVSLLEQPRVSPGDIGAGASISPAKAVYNIWKNIVRGTTKQGFFSDNLLTSGRLPGSFRGRLVQKNISTAIAQGLSAGEDIFTVNVSEKSIREMAADVARTTGQDVRELTESFLSKASAGELYGGLTPRPQHAGSHLPIVRIGKGNWDKQAVTATEDLIALDPFLAYTIERDFDKDVGELAVLTDEDLVGKAHPRDLIKRQFKNKEQQFRGWAKAAGNKVKVQEAILDIRGRGGIPNFAKIREFALPYFGFGKIPPISFVGSYATLAFGSAIADPTLGSASSVVDYLQRTSGDFIGYKPGQEIRPADIERYRQMLAGAGGNVQRGLALGVELQRNPYQATITKGGEHVQSLVDDFLSSAAIVAEELKTQSDEEVLENSILRTRKFLTNMLGGLEGKDASDVLSKLKTGFSYEGTTSEIIEQASKDLGSLYGVAAIAHARHFKEGMSSRHVIHEALGRVRGSLTGFYHLATGKRHEDLEQIAQEEISLLDIEMSNELDDTARLVKEDALNTAEKQLKNRLAGSQVLTHIGEKLKNNWRAIVGVTVGLAALRQFMIGTASIGEMPDSGDPYGNAPLPKDPMIGSNGEASIPMSIGQTNTYIMPYDGYSTSVNLDRTVTSENIEGVIGNAYALMNRSNSFNSLEITDDRSFKSNWELSNMANAQSNSDFIHEYQNFA